MKIAKDLVAASAVPLVLAILTDSESYGYAIIQRVHDLSHGAIEWSDGMLYPVLHWLEENDFVRARWRLAETGRRRRYYSITPQGRAQLAEEQRQWQAVDATLRSSWQKLALAAPAAGGWATVAPPQGA
jgi:PadR family transcriptional regulator